jgi:hypothetical protein
VAGLSGGGGDQSAPLREVAPRAPGPILDDALEQKGPGPPGVAAGDAERKAAPLYALSGTGARRVEHTARLKLAAPPDELDHVADRIVDVTDRHRGLVIDSSISTGAESGQGGSFSLRIPTTELTETLRELSRLGEVRERSQSEQDVTRQYSSVADRLASARLERRGLERRLAHATSTAEGDRLRARLDALNEQIHGLRDKLGHLRLRTDYTRLSVTLVAGDAAQSPIGGAGDALNGSLRALVNTLAVTLRVLAAVLPFVLLGALAWAAAGVLRRRRREAALS